jgi:hypothetical protein
VFVLAKPNEAGPSTIKHIAALNYSAKWDYSLKKVNFQNPVVAKFLF